MRNGARHWTQKYSAASGSGFERHARQTGSFRDRLRRDWLPGVAPDSIADSAARAEADGQMLADAEDAGVADWLIADFRAAEYRNICDGRKGFSRPSESIASRTCSSSRR